MQEFFVTVDLVVLTIRDDRLYELMRALYTTEQIFIEPSSCACFAALLQKDAMQRYCAQKNLTGRMAAATHVVWATGGSLVPPAVRAEYLRKAGAAPEVLPG